ncbi:MAG TPA: molybdopterin-dependent oxidoreductase, partial [Novosphingobium sp.]|nr:molybdopterin-dependent oxidoreductase [Novosphingobium sp.]
MIEVRPSFCRNCLAFCPIIVTLEDGRVTKVVGDPEAEGYEGYSCPKGRALPDQLYDPARLLTSVKRTAGGGHVPIASADAVAEVASALRRIIDEYGPQSVAMYVGTGSQQHTFGPKTGAALLKALGSPLVFSAATIDKPAEKTSLAFHGHWQAGGQRFEDSDTWMLVGANPVIAKSNGLPYNNPARRLTDAVKRGMKLIVVDPRRTETARQAAVYLPVRPGEDPTLLAGLIHIILRDELHDQAFVAENAEGLEALRKATDAYGPAYVAERAGVAQESLIEAAHTFARAKRGGVICATGPSFSLNGDLTFYLGLCLNTLCGRWAKAGDPAPFPNVLLPAYTPRAQPQGPYPAIGNRRFRTRNFRQSVSGFPTAALPDEILIPGEEQIRALICVGGNPVSAWPDQRKAEAALSQLDLLVTLDNQISATGEHAHYVIAPPMALEVPGTTHNMEYLKYLGVSRGLQRPWAQYSQAVAPLPAGSDLIEEHAFFYSLAAALDLELDVTVPHAIGPHIESPAARIAFPKGYVPTLDEVYEQAFANSRVPFSEIKQYPHGHVFDVDVVVEPRDPACSDRLQIGDPLMMQELARIREEGLASGSGNPDLPYMLICRRANAFMNSVGIDLVQLNRGKRYNALFMHPADAAELGLVSGAVVRIRSGHGAIGGIVEPDDTLRRGCVAMTHGFGTGGDRRSGDPYLGSNVNQLVSV